MRLGISSIIPRTYVIPPPENKRLLSNACHSTYSPLLGMLGAPASSLKPVFVREPCTTCAMVGVAPTSVMICSCMLGTALKAGEKVMVFSPTTIDV
jgi:hypothetical protein